MTGVKLLNVVGRGEKLQVTPFILLFSNFSSFRIIEFKLITHRKL